MRKITPYLMIAPFFIGFILFTLYPTIYAIRISFYNWDGMSPMKYIGFKNYTTILKSKVFLNSLKTSTIFVLTGPVASLVGLLAATLLNTKLIKGSNFYRLACFVPYLTIPVAIGILFTMLLGWDYGIINRIMISLGIYDTPINFLGTRSLVFFCMSLLVTWRYFGYHMVIYTGGMQSIDQTLYEAAWIDGATDVQSFFKITIPLMKPYIVYLMITSISGGMNMFDEPMMLYGTSGGAGGMAQNIGMFVYQQTFVSNRWGYGSALSFISFIIIAVLTVVFYRINYRNGMEG